MPTKVFLLPGYFFQHIPQIITYLLWLKIFLFNLCANPFHLKLPLLLSQYLREQKTLSLPGIGIFHFTAPLPANDESSTSLPPQIKFENKKIKEPDDSLI